MGADDEARSGRSRAPEQRPESPIGVELFLDFIEDRRTSMEAYAGCLSAALQECTPDEVCVRQFRPRYPFSARAGLHWQQRLARYASYPWQVRGRAAHVNHIVDHGYAHLLWSLPPRRTVITVHDLIPLAVHRGKIPGVRRRRSHLSEISARLLGKAASLIAVSEQTKLDLVDFCRVPEALVTVVPLGVSPLFRKIETGRRALRAR
jgi:hypothetical protein